MSELNSEDIYGEEAYGEDGIERDENTYDIARVRSHNYIGRFLYPNIKELLVGEACVVNTEEGQEFGTVVSMAKVRNVNLSNIIKFDEQHRAIYQDDDDDSRRNFRVKNDSNHIYEIVRKANEEDIKHYKENKEKEEKAFEECVEKIIYHKLDMKLISVHYFFDRSKILFEFISDHRVDFRELVKDLASHFHTRIELRQIGVRDEAKIIGGCGICGRELCCNLMKSNFEAISIKMAKEQGMPLNTAKISGLCGRLMCCLHYEYETYIDLKKDLPSPGQRVVFNDSPAVICDVNPLCRKVLLRTEDQRLIYVSADEIKKSGGGSLEVKVEVE